MWVRVATAHERAFVLEDLDIVDPGFGGQFPVFFLPQVDNRLQGSARSQVAVRLAVIYLMARKPDRAIKALYASRSADLPGELRTVRATMRRGESM